jgi:hypothetical protein
VNGTSLPKSVVWWPLSRTSDRTSELEADFSAQRRQRSCPQPVAEKELLSVVNDRDAKPAGAAIRFLGEMGTEQSVPVLEAVVQSNGALRDSANKALSAIKARRKP